MIPNWNLAHKFWSIRLALFWAVIAGLWVALPAFQSFMSPVVFALLCICFSVAIVIARITNQPGIS